MNYKHFREINAKFHIFLLLSIMGGISLITIYDRKFIHNRPEEGLPKIIIVNHLYFAYKSPLGKDTSTGGQGYKETLGGGIIEGWNIIGHAFVK